MKLFYRLSLLLLLALQAACSDSDSSKRTVVYQPVSTVQLSEQPSFIIARRYTGIVAAVQSANLAFELPGTVQAVLVSEGDRVAKGALLARLDTALLDVERRQLEAGLVEARANLRLSAANLQRQSSLEVGGYASRQRRDELEASRDALQANIIRMQAQLDGNSIRHEKSKLYAPFAGVVGERFLHEGNAAGPGVTAFRVLEDERLEAHIGVPDKLAAQIAIGDIATLHVAQGQLDGEVLAVGSELKDRSHAVMIRVKLPASASLVGSVVQLELQDTIDVTGFKIPDSALTASMRGLWRVYVVTPAEQGLHRVEARDLQVRYSGEGFAFVTGGVRHGESIVADGLHKIVPGQLVKISAGS